MAYTKRKTDYPNNLRQHRTDRLLTQQALATRAGVSLRTLHSLEKGCGCTADTAERIVKALELPLRETTKVFPTFCWSGLGTMHIGHEPPLSG